MTDMLTPYTQNDDVTVTFPDDEGQTNVTARIEYDGGDDVPTWATASVHVQIDTDDSVQRSLVVHLNDGPPIYQGYPEMHESAAEVLRQVRAALNGPDIHGERRRIDALNIIKRSGVIL